MNMRNLAAAGAALSLVATPASAQATTVSIANVDRIGAASADESGLAGSNVLIGIVALAAIIGAIVVIADNGDDDPVSP